MCRLLRGSYHVTAGFYEGSEDAGILPTCPRAHSVAEIAMTRPHSLDWLALAVACSQVTDQNDLHAPSDSDLINACLPPTSPVLTVLKQQGLHQLEVPEKPQSNGSKREKYRTAAASGLGLEDFLLQLQNQPLGSIQQQQLLLTWLHVLTKGPGLQIVSAALASAAGKNLIEQLATIHTSVADLPSMTSHLLLASYCAGAAACQQAGADPEAAQDAGVALSHLASSPVALEVLIGHLVFLAMQPTQLFTQRGLVSATRALRVLFSLQAPGAVFSTQIQKLCTAADLSGRVLQIMEYQPSQYLRNSAQPLDASKGQTTGELYLQLLSAAVAYVGFASDIFSATEGSLTLNVEKLKTTSVFLLHPNTLPALRNTLDGLTRALYFNDMLSHVECPETRHLDASLRNVLMMFALPLCSGCKTQADTVELATFSLRLYRQLYRLEFLPILQRMLHASNPEEPASQQRSTAPSPTGRAPYYSDGPLQGFFSTTAAVMCDALTTVGSSLAIDQLSVEQEAEMAAFIMQQLPRLAAWAKVLIDGVQTSQLAYNQSRSYLPYRPAMYTPGSDDNIDAGASEEHTASNTGRCCATCASRPGKLLTCKNCAVAVYCSRDCQLAHWHAVHKVQCKLLQQQKARNVANT